MATNINTNTTLVQVDVRTTTKTVTLPLAAQSLGRAITIKDKFGNAQNNPITIQTLGSDLIDNLYKSIISAGTFKASSIKVAEAAKVIENSQRDINIAFVNELAKIFNLLNIDTNEVLEAAGTKWNFLKFKPGLVGGHCIGVDPYYLAHKAMELGYNPEIILSGRRLNDRMSEYFLILVNSVNLLQPHRNHHRHR